MRKLLAATSVATLCLMSAASAQETINMWVRTGIGTAFTGVVEAYNASHDNQVVLTEVPFSELVQKYATSIAGGQAPDALSLDLIYTPAFAAAGQLEDLTDWAQGLPYFDALAPSHVKLGTYEGKIYGLPLSVETSVFAWNKDLYEQAGLDPEKAPAQSSTPKVRSRQRSRAAPWTVSSTERRCTSCCTRSRQVAPRSPESKRSRTASPPSASQSGRTRASPW